MKKIIFIALIFLNLFVLFAQDATSISTDDTITSDTTETTTNETNATSTEENTPTPETTEPTETTDLDKSEADKTSETNTPEDTTITEPIDDRGTKAAKIFNDILICAIIGTSENPLAVQNAHLSAPLAPIFRSPKRINGHYVLTLFDYYLPEFIGLIASNVSYSASEEDASWLSEIFTNEKNEFFIYRPKELDKAEKDLEKVLEDEGLTDNTLTTDKDKTSNAIPIQEIDENDNSELEDLIKSSNAAIAEEEKQKDKEKEEEKVPERKIKNSQNMLSLYSYGKEIFTAKQKENSRITITAFEKKLDRQYFDEKMRLVKKEHWDLTGGVASAHKIKTENYEYTDGKYPIKAVISGDDFINQLKYDENGRVLENRNFSLLKIQEEKKDTNTSTTTNTSTNTTETNKNTEPPKKRFILKNRTSFKYTEDGKVSEKYFIEYTYKDEFSTQITSRNSKKENYFYKITDGSPDYYYYENGVLRLKTEYSGEKTYTTTAYFDGDFVVEAYYEEGNHKKDYYYMNGNLIRTRDYE